MDLDAWKHQVTERLQHFAAHARDEVEGEGPPLVYGLLAGVALWPIARAVRQEGLAAVFELQRLHDDASVDSIVNQLPSWENEADAAAKLARAANDDIEVRTALDAILNRLGVLSILLSFLSEPDRAWLAELVLTELSSAGRTAMVGAGVGGDAASGRSATILGDSNIVLTGDVVGNVTITVAQGESEREGIDPEALREAYLFRLFNQTRGLPVIGVDREVIGDAGPVEPPGKGVSGQSLELARVYTALQTRRGEGELVARGPSVLEMLNTNPLLVLLGDPGSGKSTLVSFVTLCLVGEALGDRAPPGQQANLALLTYSQVDQQTEGEPAHQQRSLDSQPWQHGALLPVRVILRDLAARGLPPAGQEGSGDDLWRFVESELGTNLAEYASHLKRELFEQGGLILLDGLDEVPEAGGRREQVKKIIIGFVSDFPRCRFVVTSRTYAYERDESKLAGFIEAVLAPFGPGQIKQFVDRWYAAHTVAPWNLHPDDAQGRAEVLKADIEGSDRLKELASRPLLLTLMASLHARRGGSLPDKREELYAAAVDLLLDQWEGPKVVHAKEGSVLVQLPSLVEWLRVDRGAVRALLNRLAFEGHRDQAQLEDTADVSQTALVHGLLEVSDDSELKPIQLVDHLRDRAGLLVSRDRDEGVYTFPHRTFQEYLAACYLTARDDCPVYLAQLVRADPQRWHEVTLLAAAKVARGAAYAVWGLVEELCYEEPSSELAEGDCWGALLAARALIETERLGAVSPRNQKTVDLVRRWLVRLIEGGKLTGVDRSLAGNALSILGDPRFDDGAFGLPCGSERRPEPLLGFVLVEAGSFQMGSERFDRYEDEQPVHAVELGEYYVARYPVTNAQYAAFVQASDREPPQHWDGACVVPALRHHPVVHVSWYDAMAYATWLTECLHDYEDLPSELTARLRDESWVVRLPTEAEWEKAARGHAAWEYPWASGLEDGQEVPLAEVFDPEHCNAWETRIRSTSAVGLFPGGASPYGLLDMSGNVWEWCRSVLGAYPYRVDDGRERVERQEMADVRVVRGGSWADDQINVRCAYREFNSPDGRANTIGFRVVIAPAL
jgi:formylglycine-generating enzyme required for sulfatase activity